MRFVYPDAKEWKYLIASLATLIDEANFVATSEGLKLRALDPSRIAMVDLEMPSEVFEEYEIDEEKIKIGVNFDDLNKVVKRGRADERVMFEVSERRLKVTILGKAERSFALPLIDVYGEELPVPRVTFTVTAKMLSDVLKDALSDASLVSDSVKFRGETDYLLLSARSDRGEVEVRFSMDAGSLIDYEVEEPASAAYSLSYLTDIVKKSAQLTDVTTLKFATNKPISLSFEMPGGGKLTFYLAPRMEE